MSKYESMYSLNNTLKELIDNGDKDKALRLIYNFVEKIITEPLCVAQVFGSKSLDYCCQRIGKDNFTRINFSNSDHQPRLDDQSFVVYVVTKLQKSGGHTRIIEDLIRGRPGAKHFILSTELIGKSDVDYVVKKLTKGGNVVFEKAPKLDFQNTLTWLQQRLLKIHPTKVYLLNHHQDSVAVAAIQPEMNLDASFYHHGDHHLCLGVYLSHLEHIDPHPMGFHNCRDALGIDNTYIPLTVDDIGARSVDWPFIHDGVLTTCTAAKSNKIEIPYFVSYLDIVPQLLKVSGGRHIHIGRLTPWALFRIRRGLRRHGVHSDRFIYIPWVASVWQALLEYRVDLYVASFPYGGGLTLIEAMGAGIPVALHKHVFSRVLSSIDLAYPDAFSWGAPDGLLDYCASLTPEILEKASHSGRVQYEKFHSFENFQKVLDIAGRDRPKPADLSGDFSVESDEMAIWMERQLTIGRVFSRALYRLFRRLRAWRWV